MSISQTLKKFHKNQIESIKNEKIMNVKKLILCYHFDVYHCKKMSKKRMTNIIVIKILKKLISL